jgi:hypothetical protein
MVKNKQELERMTKKELEEYTIKTFGKDLVDRRRNKNSIIKHILSQTQHNKEEEEESPPPLSSPKKQTVEYQGETYHLIKHHAQGFSDYQTQNKKKNLSIWR